MSKQEIDNAKVEQILATRNPTQEQIRALTPEELDEVLKRMGLPEVI